MTNLLTNTKHWNGYYARISFNITSEGIESGHKLSLLIRQDPGNSW